MALLIVPLALGVFGVLIERLFLQHVRKLDHLYGLILTFGLALIIEGLFRNYYGSSGQPYEVPEALRGGHNLGFMFLPNYRAWVIAFSLTICFLTWFAIERTRLGSYLRAATENPALVRAFGINVPRMVTLTYGFGVALAALAGVMAAPIYNVSPQMGSDLIIVVFAVVVIGGMGSIMGAIVTGFVLGIVEGLTKVFFPEASNTVIFVIMVIVLLVRPAAVRTDRMMERVVDPLVLLRRRETNASFVAGFVILVALFAVLPFVAYPVFLMQVLCFALFACAFNLLIGYVGLVSFGHALYFGFAGYLSAYVAKYGTISFPFWFGKLIWLSIPLPAQSPALAVLVGTVTAAVLGIIAGGIAIRRQGIYFAMITLALAQMMYFFALRAPFTGGEDGSRRCRAVACSAISTCPTK